MHTRMKTNTLTRFLFMCCFFISTTISFSQCPTCGNGIIDAGETNTNCPQDVPMGATCTSPCSQPVPFETTVGTRQAFDFTGTTTFSSAGLPAGWAFASAPTSTTTGTLGAAGTDAYGAKAGLIQPNCSGSCTSTNGFCIGNIASSTAVGAGGTGGKLGANFDGRANINANLSYAVLRGQGNPTLVSPTFDFSAVEGFKLQFWVCASESSCGQTNGWGGCVGNNAFLDFSSNGGTSWTQILTLNNSSTNVDMCTSNSTNTFWIQEGTWHRVCLTVYKSTTSPGNFYPAAGAGTAASGMMVSSTWFNANFKYRIRYAQTASCTAGISATNPGRYLAIDYPVITSGNQMIPCGISFINMCGYGADNNNDGVGSTATTTTTVFGTVRRGVNNAERGVEILTSQNASFTSQNLSGGTFATDFDLCNAEGGDKQCIGWQGSNGFYTAIYEALMDFERPNINLQYYKGTTPQSTTLTKVTSSGETPTIGWRYSGNRFVSCGSLSDLNPGCNGYSFQTPSLPNQFIRAFYQLSINSLGQAWPFYGPSSCSNYFNGPFLAPIATPGFISGETDFLVCNPNPVFTGVVNYCADDNGFTGTPTLTITGPNGFNETINSGGTGITPVVDPGTYTITPNVPNAPMQCVDCKRPVCVTLTAADLIICAVLPVNLTAFTAQPNENGVLLNWTTSSETNNDYFLLEKSVDGILFSFIGKIAGAGNSTVPLDYTFRDDELSAGTVYYRLKQVDFNGTVSYSTIVSVNMNETLVEIFPNPNDGIFTVTCERNNARVAVINVLGEVLFEKSMNSTKTLDIDISTQPAGMYFIRVVTGNKPVVKKIVVE